MKRNLIVFCLTLIASVLLFNSKTVLAEDYDLYVDQDYDGGDAEGTSEKPYTSISKALEKSKDGDKVYIKNGTYEEEIVLEKEVDLYGQDKNKTIIKGKSGSTVEAKDNSVLKNLTVSGGYSGVVFNKKGEIKNCIIEKVQKNAIDAKAGSSELKITDSKITGNAKGVYVQTGRVMLIANNEFISNIEEGIDVRDRTRGSIQNNEISSNGEGGIEIIVGSARVTIKNNIIRKNNASGIAAQFYTIAQKTGEIKIENNKIERNGHFGIVCKAPSGGKSSKNYWNDSLNLISNTIENNKDLAIAKSCKMAGAVTEEEIKENQIPNEEVENIVSAEAEPELETEDIYMSEELPLINAIDALKPGIEELNKSSLELVESLQKRSPIKTFFVGTNYEKINQLRQLDEQQKNNLRRLQEIKSSNSSDFLNEIIDPLIESTEKNITSNDNFIVSQESKFSLLGWLFRKL